MDISDIALSGLHRAEVKLEKAAIRIASSGDNSFGGANVDTIDLSAEMVALMLAKSEFSANLKTLGAASEMKRSLINLMA